MAKKVFTDESLQTFVDEIKAGLDSKSSTSHTHKYAGSSSVGGSATSANKVNSSLTVKLNGGTTEGTNLFTFNGSSAKSVNITPSSIGAATSSHNHDDRYYTETEVDTKLSGKANTSHGNHVPATQTASNKVFLRNDNTWATVTPANIGAAASSHTHKVANISDLTATATELNYMDGVTSNVQTQLDGKAASGHTHAISNISGLQSALDGKAASSHGRHVPSACTSITDWNNATSTGWYMGNSASNAPTTGTNVWYFGYVIAHNTEYVYQEAYQFTKSTDAKNIPKYIRAKNNSTWGSWTEVTVQKAVPSDAKFTDTTYSAAGSSLGLVKSGGDVTISSGVITVNDDSHNHTIANVDNLQTTLDGKQATITGGASTVTSSNLTASRALVSDSNGKVAVSAVTSTELGYLDGVTSSVQTQLDSKASKSAATTSANGLMTSAMVTKLNGIAEGANKYSLPTASSSTLGGVKTTSTVTSNSGYTACPIIGGVPYYKDTNTTYSLGSFGITATAAELNYCDGVTSNIQTQLNNKANASHSHSYLANKGTNTINAIANDTTVKWKEQLFSTHMYNVNNYLNNQPSQYGLLLNTVAGGEVHQLWMEQPGGSLFHRGGNASGWSGTWKKILDSSNYSSYCLPLSGGTLTGTLMVNATLQVGNTSKNGYVEIYSDTPFIDFHFGRNSADYTSRIIEYKSGVLKTTGASIVAGTFKSYGATYLGINDSDTTEPIAQRGVYLNRTAVATSELNFRPQEDNVPALGLGSYRWTKVYSVSSSISTSDEREKDNIISIKDYPVTYADESNENIFEQLFDKLDPKIYNRTTGNSEELHIGFIAQDIVKSANELGISESDLAVIDHTYWTDEETSEEKDRYGLAYEEFIALNTHIIQKQKARISDLEERIGSLESKLNELVG